MPLRFLLILTAFAAGCSDCGGDGSRPVDAGVGDVRDDVRASPDVGPPAMDVAAEVGPDADGDDGGSSGGYDGRLDDLGDPPTICDLSIGAEAASPDARFFIASHRLDDEDLESLATFRESIHRQVFDNVLGCRHADAPNVVVFPESMSLPMLAIGETAARARRTATATEALTQLALAISETFQFYGNEFPDSAIGTRVLLARTDTVVRATRDTFSAIAERYGVWVSVTVDLPEYLAESDPDVVATIADPDIGSVDTAFRAMTDEVTNQQILFAPDGTVHDATHKTYVTQLELSQLALTPGEFREIGPMDTPWGPTGVVISKPAWMVDVQDRLDDLGTTVYLQPEAFAGGWTVQTQPEAPDRWEPDVFVQGGWNLIQRSSRGMVDLVPQLTGNFFDIVFDAQLQVVEHSTRRATTGAFVGQEALSGQALVGPWVVSDPAEADPSLSLAERRAELREVGEQLAAGTAPAGVDYVEGWAAYDVDSPADGTVETHPTAVAGDDLWVAFSSGTVGSRSIVVRRYDDPSGAPTAETELAEAGADRFRPQLFFSGADPYVHFEQFAGGENVTWVSDVGGNAAGQAVGGAQTYRMRSRELTTGGEIRVFVREVDDANRVFVAVPGLDDAVELEPRPSDRGVLRANQWDPDVATSGTDAVVAWTDFKNWRWEIWAAHSSDSGATWSEPFGVSLGSDIVETFSSTPRVLAVGEGRFVISWTDLRTSRLRSGARAALVDVTSVSPVVAWDVRLSDADDWAWRPMATVEGGDVRFVWEVMNSDGSRGVETTSLDPLVGAPGSAVEIVRRDDARMNFPFVVAYDSSMWVGWELTEARSGSSEIELMQLP